MTLRSSSLIYIIASAVNAVVPFLLLGYLARELGPAEFGLVGQFLVLVNLASVLIGANTHGMVSVLYFREGGDEGASRAIKSASVVLAGSTVLLAVIAMTVEGAIGLSSIIPSPGLILAVGCGLVQFLQLQCLTYLQCSSRAVMYGVLSITASLAVAGMTLLLLEFESSWLARSYGQLAGGGIVAGLATWLLITRLNVLSAAVDRKLVSRVLRYGVPLVPHSLALAAMAGYDRLYLGDNVTQDVVGQYFGASAIASVIGLAAAAFNQAWVPWVYGRLKSRTSETDGEIVQVAWIGILLLGTTAAAVSAVADWLTTIVLGPGYGEASRVLPVLVFASAIGSIYFLIANTLFYFEATRTLPIVTCVSAALQIVLIHLLGGSFGVDGVAWSALIAQSFFVGGVWWLAQKTYPLPWLRRLWV